ncbi:hypothetical protein M2138_000624 [Dysgonomonadaceae bacterium PH5-43]|nr:hypothetical protein [Dysgonomonadaceae bacterium PH5-43]
MKNKILLLGLLFSVTFSSCTDWLDIKPLNSMVMEDFWKTKDDVESVVMASYEAMTTADLLSRLIVAGELRSDNVAKGSNVGTEIEDIFNVTMQETNYYAKWDSFYKVISYCNNVIEFAPGVQKLDPDYTDGLLKIHLAEAKTIRALMYFYLVRIYKNVPFIDKPYVDDTQNTQIPQMDGDLLLRTYIVPDLLESEGWALKSRGNIFLSNSARINNKGRITKNAVRALLADVYLWLNEYDECSKACDRVLAEELTDEEFDQARIEKFTNLTGSELYLLSNKTGTTPIRSNTYPFIFGGNGEQFEENNNGVEAFGNSNESIFELQMRTTNGGRGVVYTFYGSSSGGQILYASSLNEWNIFTSRGTDYRQKEFYYAPAAASNATAAEPAKILKYVGRRTGDSSVDMNSSSEEVNWIFYRLPDVILMKAEALVERNSENDLEDAFNLVFRVNDRSNPNSDLKYASFNSQDAMRKLVLLERQREFLFEGKRWFDLLRITRREGSSQSVVTNYLSRNFTFGDVIESKLTDLNAFYFPVHKDELTSNLALEQNPYYETEVNYDEENPEDGGSTGEEGTGEEGTGEEETNQEGNSQE